MNHAKNMHIINFNLHTTTFLQDNVTGLRFGTFGREEGALIVLYKNKGMDVKILQR